MNIFLLTLSLLLQVNYYDSPSFTHYQRIMDHLNEKSATLRANPGEKEDFAAYFNTLLGPELVELQKISSYDLQTEMAPAHEIGNALITVYTEASGLAAVAGFRDLAEKLMNLPLKLSIGTTRSISSKQFLAWRQSHDDAMVTYEEILSDVYELGLEHEKLEDVIALRFRLAEYYDKEGFPKKAAVHYRKFLKEKMIFGSPNEEASLKARTKLFELIDKGHHPQLDQELRAFVDRVPNLIGKGRTKLSRSNKKQQKQIDDRIIAENYVKHLNLPH